MDKVNQKIWAFMHGHRLGCADLARRLQLSTRTIERWLDGTKDLPKQVWRLMHLLIEKRDIVTGEHYVAAKKCPYCDRYKLNVEICDEH